MLVHASGGREHATADVRHAHHFEQALHGAVLAVRPVKHREHGVNMPQGFEVLAGAGSRETRMLAHEEAVAALTDVEHHGTGFRRDFDGRHVRAIQLERARIRAAVHPVAVLGDADGNRLELVIVPCVEHTGGGDAGDGMFVSAAAVQHDDSLLGHDGFLPIAAARCARR